MGLVGMHPSANRKSKFAAGDTEMVDSEVDPPALPEREKLACPAEYSTRWLGAESDSEWSLSDEPHPDICREPEE